MPDEDRNSRQEFVNSAQNVGHADIVNNSATTDKAIVVTHADTVEKVEIHGEPLRSDKARRLAYAREIARNAVTFFALLVMIIVIIDKNNDENALRIQINQLRTERADSDSVTLDKLSCARRYQDITDQYTEKQLILIGEFLVVITQIVPGTDRENAVKEKVSELDATNIAAREAVSLKIDYNNKGNPLPCPLPESPPPASVDPDTSVTTIPVTPTT